MNNPKMRGGVEYGVRGNGKRGDLGNKGGGGIRGA